VPATNRDFQPVRGWWSGGPREPTSRRPGPRRATAGFRPRDGGPRPVERGARAAQLGEWQVERQPSRDFATWDFQVTVSPQGPGTVMAKTACSCRRPTGEGARPPGQLARELSPIGCPTFATSHERLLRPPNPGSLRNGLPLYEPRSTRRTPLLRRRRGGKTPRDRGGRWGHT